MRNHFANTKTLARFILRRDRVRAPIWILALVGISVILALSFPGLYPAGPERDILAETMKNPAMTSMLGPGYGLDDYHMGAVMAHQMMLFSAVAVAIMNILLAIRHTRADEEAGRIEVICSLPVGKLANAAATFFVLVLVNLILALTMGMALAVLGIEGMDLAGSLLYGAVLGITGVIFASVTILIAQLTETSRGAMGLSFAFMGLSYLLRAIGDLRREVLSLLSPLGLVLRTQVYVNNYWWPILVLAAASGLVVLVAFRINLNRDLEAGVIAARPGPSRASRFLLSPLGLTLRLQKTAIISWMIGMFVLGVSYGSVFGDIDAFFQTSDLFELLLPTTEGFSLIDKFTSTLLAVLTMIGMVPVLLTILKLRSEEKANRLEHLLARAMPRKTIMGSYMLVAVLLAIVVQVLSVLGLWSAAAAVLEDPFSLGTTLLGGLSYLPVMWIMVGLAACLIAFAPKRTSLIWLYLGYTFFVIYFGGLLQVPEWIVKLTPFGFVPDVPLETMSLPLTSSLLVVAIGLALLGLKGYQKRDIQG